MNLKVVLFALKRSKKQIALRKLSISQNNFINGYNSPGIHCGDAKSMQTKWEVSENFVNFSEEASDFRAPALTSDTQKR